MYIKEHTLYDVLQEHIRLHMSYCETLVKNYRGITKQVRLQRRLV